jgi:glyoxylase-like metal-dependent hydrolase (beta-lactamase superfamily II)
METFTPAPCDSEHIMVSRLTDTVWQFELRGVNAYLVDDDVLTLVDAGTPFDDDAIRTGLIELGYDVGDLERVLLTHYDFDHVGALAALEPDLDATVYASAFDGGLLTGDRSPPLTNHKGILQRVLGPLVSDPSLPVRTVADGDEVGSFTAYHTPGHSPGHVAYVSRQVGAGLLGDLVTESDGELRASGRVVSYDTGAVRDSIVSLAERAPPFEVACMGHGTPLASGGSAALQSLANTL